MLADKREAPESAKHSIRYKAKLYLEKSEALFITLHLVVVGSVEEKGAKKKQRKCPAGGMSLPVRIPGDPAGREPKTATVTERAKMVRPAARDRRARL